MLEGWLITVPVWGERYRNLFKQNGLPSIKAALTQAKLPARFLVSVEGAEPDKLTEDLFAPYPVTIKNIDTTGGKYESYGRGHREAFTEARPNEVIALFPADAVVSVEIFAACEKHLSNGKRAVAYCGLRTLEGDPPPIGATAKNLTAWAMQNAHQWIKDCHWPNGCSLDPAYVFFNDGTNNNTVLHPFVLGPLAIVNDRTLDFRYTTDVNLLECYTQDEIHVVTDMTELAATDVSSADQVFPVGTPMTAESVAAYAKRIGLNERNQWSFTQRVVVLGNPSPELGQKEVNDILTELNSIYKKEKDLVADLAAELMKGNQ